MSQLQMIPACGERLLRFVGDRIRFELHAKGGWPAGFRAVLRTNIGRAAQARSEIIAACFKKIPLAGASWRDIQMRPQDGKWFVELPLTEVGFFQAKAYAVDARGRQHWPEGPNVGISVHPDDCRTGNVIYCAFPRLFGQSRSMAVAQDEAWEKQLRALDARNYTVIPPSGTFRDLKAQLPHIFEKLGCRILHLLPINPTPTVYARFGRYGSPYACQDLTAVDPALAEFDRRTTALEQFLELVRAVHLHGGKLFLDLVINHTGWGSTLWEKHPEWFKRTPDGEFQSPGAWGNVWRDLVELDQRHPALWTELAEAFLTWCRRGVDGFRCDAGYKVPAHVWQHIVARVRQEYPNTVFLLEGLGGSWEATEILLTDGGMQWAYSELFQNYSGTDVARYLDYALGQSRRVGLYVHYSETHDNPRLAARGRAWSLLRNRLCALTSVCGGFGFTCGVEWLATEKINVHQCTGLSWGASDNLLPELAALNKLLAQHPCFFDGAVLTRLSADDSPVLALKRKSADGKDAVLVLVNTDVERAHSISLKRPALPFAETVVDLLGQPPPKRQQAGSAEIIFHLDAGAAYCLAESAKPAGLAGDEYRKLRAQAAWALCALSHYLPLEKIGPAPWHELARMTADASRFLAALPWVNPEAASKDLLGAIKTAMKGEYYPMVTVWTPADIRRVTLVPPEHWLLLRDTVSFCATLKAEADELPRHLQSLEIAGGHIVAFPPSKTTGPALLHVERNIPGQPALKAAIEFLPDSPPPATVDLEAIKNPPTPLDAPLILLTNGIGGMARMCVDLGRVKSKYDCVLAANLHPQFPVDRHVFIKRIRLWANADGFITQLNGDNLVAFAPGPPATWEFVANAGDGRSVEIRLRANMLQNRNSIVFELERPKNPPPLGRDLPPECDVSITVRFDIEDRNFHWETHRNAGAEHHFSTHTHPLADSIGFCFNPAPERSLRVYASGGFYHHEAEWSHLLHPVEGSRGQTDCGDGYSPGWFELPLPKGARLLLVASADSDNPTPAEIEGALGEKPHAGARHHPEKNAGASSAIADDFGARLLKAASAFVVRRGSGKTVIAGYPWFLDWGRDTLICARGLLAAGWRDEVLKILAVFGRFEQGGTLPNALFGDNASNRETSDAPLWYGVVCEEAASSAEIGPSVYEREVEGGGRTILDVVRSIAENCIKGAANGVQMDAASGLLFSPAHFTWMDTQYPACTPREGYPIEIQALWIRLLRQLARLKIARKGESFADVAGVAEASFNRLFWLEQERWLADTLLAGQGTHADKATPDRALRCNCLLPVGLGLVRADRARACVEAATRHLLVPGAVRSLAPLPASPPLPIRDKDGRLLNNPSEPYWGRYEGDEDSRRKPAYHNGTAWTWMLPVYCEALVRAWDFEPAAIAAARATLGSMQLLMNKNCLGHVPEILDGDAPHQTRGCDAQAWGVTEALRVWRLLESSPPTSDAKEI